LRIPFQDVLEGKMVILTMVAAKPMESSVDIVLARMDCLSQIFICPCQLTQETGLICDHGLKSNYYNISQARVLDKHFLMSQSVFQVLTELPIWSGAEYQQVLHGR
jgi:hypothetical protein